MIITSPELTANSATIQSIDIGEVRVGPITVGDLVVNNTNVSMAGASGVLHGVSVAISIHVSFEWHIHIGLPDFIPDIDEGDTYDLGTLDFPPVGIGDVNLPALNNINLNIPSIAGQQSSASVAPLQLSLGKTTASEIEAEDVNLPADGFSINGLGLGSAQVNDVGVPRTTIARAKVARLTGDTLQLPELTLSNLNVGALQIPTVSSTAALDIPAVLDTRSIGFDAGILRVALHLTPSASSHIDSLEINNANATATAGQVVIHNVTLPYEVLNLTLSEIGIRNLVMPTISVS